MVDKTLAPPVTSEVLPYPESSVPPDGSVLRTNWPATARLWAFGLIKVPMIFTVRPRVQWIDEQGCGILVPLRRKTENHYRTMYFGAIVVGADCAAGILAMHRLPRFDKPISLLFQAVQIDFLRRPDGDLVLVSQDGARMTQSMEEAVRTGQRVSLPIYLSGFVPKQSTTQPVVRAAMTVSMKVSRQGAL